MKAGVSDWFVLQASSVVSPASEHAVSVFNKISD